MLGKTETITLGVLICLVVLAVFLVQARNNLSSIDGQTAAVQQAGLAVPGEDTASTQLINQPMTITDLKLGTGPEAATGDTVAVHYTGRLQDGTEFDSSHNRGTPIEFTLGSGQVIAGWEEGIAGMQVGGERTLVIPPEKAYGEAGIGPIPPNATLVFAVQLVAIK